MGYYLTTADDGEIPAEVSSIPCIKKTARGPIFKWVLSTKYTDSETRLLYYGRRYYQPETGRWTSRDPMKEFGGVNLVAFACGNPINKIDVLGLYFEITSNGKAVSSVNDVKIEYLAGMRNAEFRYSWDGLTILGERASGKRRVCAVAVEVGIIIPSALPESMSTVPEALRKIAYRKHLQASDMRAAIIGVNENNAIVANSVFNYLVLSHERAHAQTFINALSEQKNVFSGFVTSTGSDNGDIEKVWEFIAHGSAYDKASGEAANKASVEAATLYCVFRSIPATHSDFNRPPVLMISATPEKRVAALDN